jgi:hypothetical protein
MFDVSERFFENAVWNGPVALPLPSEQSTVVDAADSLIPVPQGSSRAEINPRPRVVLPFARAADKLAKAPEAPEWLWNGYLAASTVTLLAGKPKVGKSTLLFALLAALSQGQVFLSFETRCTGALLLSEEREATLTEKYDRWGIEDSLHLLLRHEAYGVAWEEVVAQAVDECQRQGLSLLIIDTLDKWFDLRGDSENSAGAVNSAVQPLLRAAAGGLAVLLVTHQRKGDGSHGEAVRGSNALTGAVDIVLELERSPGSQETTRILKAVSRFSSTPDAVALALGDDGYQALGPAAQARGSEERARLVGFLEQRSPTEFTVEQLSSESGLPPGTVRKRLEDCPDVAQRGRGVRGDPYLFSFRTPTSLGEETNPLDLGSAA